MKSWIHNFRVNLTASHFWSKSKIIRCFFRSIYRKLPRNLRDSILIEVALTSLKSKTKENVKFIQMGANDGIHADPLYPILQKYAWEGMMFEPNPVMFERLQHNHSDSKAKIIFKQHAVGEEGSFVLYWCREDPGMASTHKSHVEQHIKDKQWEIMETIISMVPFDQALGDSNEFRNVDLLLMDTEGWDGKIILSIDFSKFRSDLIIFERTHLDQTTYDAVLLKLEGANYAVYDCGNDCIAISKKTNNEDLNNVRNRAHRL